MVKNIRQILLTQDQLDALDHADNPYKHNPYLTENDVKYFFERDNGLTSTTSNNVFVDKLSFDVDLGSGIEEDYIIEWTVSVYSDIGNAIMTQLLQDGDPIDSDYCYIAGGENNTFRLRTGFNKISIEGSSTIKVQFKTANGGTAKIKQVRVLLRKIVR